MPNWTCCHGALVDRSSVLAALAWGEFLALGIATGVVLPLEMRMVNNGYILIEFPAMSRRGVSLGVGSASRWMFPKGPRIRKI